MRGIYRFEVNYGRGFAVRGLFVATAAEVAEVMGREVRFGEVCGKHSDMSVDIDDACLKLVSDALADVEVFERLNLTIGHSPVAYYADQREDEDDDEKG